jgi:hypothetical protein
MEAIVQYRNINTTFSNSKNGGEQYDGHLTIHFRYGEFSPNGRNPLAHKELDQMVKMIKPIIEDLGIGRSVVNCGFGEWKDVTFQYVKKENCQQIFDEVVKLFTKLMVK